MSTQKIQDKLHVQNRDQYGDRHAEHCLEIYKLYVQMADNVSARRQSANSFFLTVNTVVVSFVSYVGLTNGTWGWVVSVAGVFLCCVWYRLVRSYRDLNSGKFKVVHAIEKLLPLSPYDAEWEALGRGKDSKLYLQFTKIEMCTPGIFAALHIVAVIASLGTYILDAVASIT